MPNTYTFIASTTVGSGGVSDITFSSIPSTYTDLVIKASIRGSYAGATIAFRLNPNSSTSNATSKVIYGDGSAVGGFSDTIIYGNVTGNSATSNTFGNLDFYIANYAGSTNKAILSEGVTENNATSQIVYLSGNLWSSSTAITSIQLVPTSGTILEFSTACLYGIKNS